MADVTVNDKYIVEAERERNELINTLNDKGLTVASDTTLPNAIKLVKSLDDNNSLTDFINGDIEEIRNENVVTLKAYALYNMTKLKNIYLPNVTVFTTQSFGNCSSLQNLTLEKVITNNTITQGMNIGCTSLKAICFPSIRQLGTQDRQTPISSNACVKAVSFPSLTSNAYWGISNNSNLCIADIGLVSTLNTVASSSNVTLRHIVLRNTSSAQTLPTTNYIYGLFRTTGGRLFVPKDTFDYSTLDNWSSLVFTQVDLEGSRYENTKWLAHKNVVDITVDGIVLGGVPDDEICSVFKYTEGFEHIYDEDGTELLDTAIIGNYVGKALTSTI